MLILEELLLSGKSDLTRPPTFYLATLIGVHLKTLGCVSLQGDEAIVLWEADLIQSYPFHSETYFILVPAHVQHFVF